MRRRISPGPSSWASRAGSAKASGWCARARWKGWGFDFMLGQRPGRQAARHRRRRPHRTGRRPSARRRSACALPSQPPGSRVARTSSIMPLDRLIPSADILSLHVPLTPETRQLIDRTALTRMKRSAYLINTTRGRGRRRSGAGVGAEGAPHRRRRARRLRTRAGGASRPARPRERRCCRRTWAAPHARRGPRWPIWPSTTCWPC